MENASDELRRVLKNKGLSKVVIDKLVEEEYSLRNFEEGVSEERLEKIGIKGGPRSTLMGMRKKDISSGFKILEFPPEFPQQKLMKQEFSQGPPVGLDRPVGLAMEHIKENCPKVFRVPPLMIVSSARTGKTTTLRGVFNALLESGNFSPIFVDFNEDSKFFRRENETDVDAFLRAVGAQLCGKRQQDYVCSIGDLEKCLNKAPHPVVLLVDELNILSSPPSRELGNILREMFLDRDDRYLAITSHWVFHPTEAFGPSESPRRADIVLVSQTMDVDKLKPLSPNSSLVPAEVALYCGFPGLIYSVKSLHFLPSERFVELVVNNGYKFDDMKKLLPNFIDQFIRGIVGYASLSFFNRFTSQDRKNKIVWPLCYAEPFLKDAGEQGVAGLIHDAHVASQLPVEDHGLEWEFIARVAVGMVALKAQVGLPLSDVERLVLGIPKTSQPCVKVIRIPKQKKTVSDAQDFILNSKELQGNRPVLALCVPEYKDFSLFDLIVYFDGTDDAGTHLRYWRGFQMKLRNGYPDKDAPSDVPGILFRGTPTKRSKPTKRVNWTYLSLSQLTNFLPHSMKLLTPQEWEQPPMEDSPTRKNGP